MSDHTWRVSNDTPVWLKPRRTIYFLTRTVNGKREDLRDRTGRLRTWKTYELAESHITAPPSSMLFVYYCRHVPTGTVTREQAYFESRAAFNACMQRWNTAHPTFWRFSEKEEEKQPMAQPESAPANLREWLSTVPDRPGWTSWDSVGKTVYEGVNTWSNEGDTLTAIGVWGNVIEGSDGEQDTVQWAVYVSDSHEPTKSGFESAESAMQWAESAFPDRFQGGEQ